VACVIGAVDVVSGLEEVSRGRQGSSARERLEELEGWRNGGIRTRPHACGRWFMIVIVYVYVRAEELVRRRCGCRGFGRVESSWMF